MGELKLREMPRSEIGSFKNMQQVIDNWKHLDKGCVTQNRWDYIQMHLDGKCNVWDHNVALVYLFDKLKALSYLEIGVLTCGSMVHALASKSIVRVTGIDPFTSTYAGIKYIKNKNVLAIVERQVHKFRKRVQLIKGLSQVELPKVKDEFDIALVDGAHNAQGAYLDLKMTLPKVKKAIVFDDIHHQSHVYLEDVAYDFAKENNLEITVNHQPPGTVIFWI